MVVARLFIIRLVVLFIRCSPLLVKPVLLLKCTVANAAREVVQFAIRQLDRGLSDHYVRNAAGRLIVYGFAHGVYIGFPGEREFEWEYALSGLDALDPAYF